MQSLSVEQLPSIRGYAWQGVGVEASSSRRIGAPDSKTRALLVDAAEALLLDEGYAAVTSRRVAAKAGLKPIERKVFAKHARRHRIVITVDHGEDALKDIHFATVENPVRLHSLQFDQAGEGDLDAVELTLLADTQQQVLDLVQRLRSVESIHSIKYGRRSSLVRRRVRDEGNGNGNGDDDDLDDENGNL